MIARLKLMPHYSPNFRILVFLFIPIFSLVTLLVFEIKIGLIVLLGAVLFAAILLKPKIIYFLLISSLAIDGFGTLPGASGGRMLGVLLTIGLTLRLAMTKETIPKDGSYKYFFLFLTGSLISFGFAKDLSLALHSYITFISLFLFYGITRYFLRNVKDINSSLNYLFFSTILVFLIVQALGVSVRSNNSTRISGGIGDPNEFAAYILVLLSLAYYRASDSTRIRSILYWICVLSFLVLAVFTNSRGGMLGFLGAASVLIYYYSIGRLRQIFFAIVILVSILSFMVPADFWTRASSIGVHTESRAINIRLENYQSALKIFVDYPLSGVGLSNFRRNSLAYGSSESTVVHNSYLEVLTGGGLFSFIPFSLILINGWNNLKIRKKYDKNMRELLICLKAAFVSFLITSVFLSAEHEKIMWFLLALISSAHYVAEQNGVRTSNS